MAFLFSPFFSGVDPAGIEVWYRRALLASAATSALRLHQRLKSLNTSASSLAILEALLAEDSFHYLIYSMVFAFLPPISGQSVVRLISLHLIFYLLGCIFLNFVLSTVMISSGLCSPNSSFKSPTSQRSDDSTGAGGMSCGL